MSDRGRPQRPGAALGGVRDGDPRGGIDAAGGAGEGGYGVARRCAVKATLVPFVGWELEGSCGERLRLGVNEVAQASMLPEGACEAFWASVLEAFGPGGRRRLNAELEDAYVEPRMLGPNPGVRWDPFGRR